ncbi:MAG TPA: hypothetical protein VKT31_00110 [Solirubrobacteraceae bacterium]|nr:hypothetical protein [Solirubrobacteraceae bacterium]
MNATPEARSQYSRGIRASAGRLLAARPLLLATLLIALVGAGLEVAAEFSRLYSVQLITYGSPIQTVSAGAHNSYALIPLALLVWALCLGPARTGAHGAVLAAFAALTTLGLLALGIALIGDRPDAHAHGLTSHYVLAATKPGPGLYLETLGAILVLAGGGLGVLQTLANARTAHYTGPGAAAGQPSRLQM